MIYIDPPYNTGKEFVYPDDYADSIQNYLELTEQINENGRRITTNTETSGRYHTNWLNMMYPRLKLARNLLRDDGVIFISIDDNEVSNLRKICDEIFGEENFVGQVIWKNKFGSGAKTKGFIGVHEYILVYSKNPIINITRDLTDEERDNYNKTRDEKFEYRGGYVTQPLAVTTFDDRPSLVYPITYNGIEIWPKKQWVWEKKRMLNAINNNEVVFNKQADGSYNIRSKKYLIDENGNERRGKPTTLFSNVYTQNGTEDIRNVFNKIPFDYSKPVELIKYFLSFEINDISDKNCIILDFFSGSATTAHAVLDLNRQDGGNRQFIMVQLPEPCEDGSEARKAGYKNICEIGKERIRRVIKKIAAEEAEKAKSKQSELKLGADGSGSAERKEPLDLGFKVFKLDTSNFISWDSNPDHFDESSLQAHLSNIKMDRSQQDLLYELFIKLGVTLNTPFEKVSLAGKNMYDIGCGTIYACLDEDLDMDFCNAMIAYHDDQFPKETDVEDKKEERELERYRLETTTFIFRDSSFANDNVKTNILQTLRQSGLENIKAI